MKRSDQKTDTSESSLPPATEAVVQITCVDVLTRGGGQGTQNHCGNVTYRKLVNLNKELYVLTSKNDKIKISKAIVAAIRKIGGRFLQAGGGGYFDIGDKKAWEKTSQSLREGQIGVKAKLAAEQATALGVQKVAEFEHVISTETYLAYACKLLVSLHHNSDFDFSHSCGPNCPYAKRRALLNGGGNMALLNNRIENNGNNNTGHAFSEPINGALLNYRLQNNGNNNTGHALSEPINSLHSMNVQSIGGYLNSQNAAPYNMTLNLPQAMSNPQVADIVHQKFREGPENWEPLQLNSMNREDTISTMDFSILSDTAAIRQMLCNDVDMNSDEMSERMSEIIRKKAQGPVRIDAFEAFKDSVFQEDSARNLSRGDSLMNDSLITIDDKNGEPKSNGKHPSRVNFVTQNKPSVSMAESASENSKINDSLFLNAIATHEEVMASGLPASPLDFPSPTFSNVIRVNASVYNPLVDDEIIVPNVIYEVRPDGRPPTRAYWIGRKLKKAIYGCVCSCSVLKVREGGWAGPDGNSLWELTDELAAVKIIDLEIIRDKRKAKSAEDPIKEVAAMQYLSREGAQPNVLPCWDAFRDEHYVYMCMPLCSKGELFEYVEWNGRFDEMVAKYWFKQLLSGLISLRRQGITHRDLSLENILIDENTHALVIDLGMCLRVPFSSPDDSRSGSLRLPLPPQGICGKPVSIYSTLQLFRPSISFTLIFVLYFLSEFYRTRGPIK